MKLDDLSNNFIWTTFYMEFADKLLQYKGKRSELLAILGDVYNRLKIQNPFTENNEPIDDICPFTVMGSFNKGITDENRIAIAKEIGNRIGVTAAVPTKFEGIPVLNNMNSWFFRFKDGRDPDDITNLWNVFEAGIHFADHHTEEEGFTDSYETVRKQHGVKWNLTMGLYWVRPFFYLNLDGKNRTYILKKGSNYAYITKISTLNDLPDAKTYLELIKYFQEGFRKGSLPHQSFPELSYAAWIAPTPEKLEGKKSNASFLKWFAPLVNALKNLGGSGTPEEARKQIVADLDLSNEIVNEIRGKSEVKKFDNDVAFARNYLVYEGYIDNSIRGKWSLTEKGRTAKIDEQIASDIFIKWVEKMKKHRGDEFHPDSDIVNISEKRYWIYSPGRNASKWNEFYTQGIMGIGWEEMEDLKKYASKEDMKGRMKELYGQEYTYMNAAHATWQFANELMPGDVIYAKKGTSKIIGYGIVESEYMYDKDRDEYNHIHKVEWKEKGEWEHPRKAVNKTLTDITPYTDYLEKLKALFVDDDVEDIEIEYDPYTENDFLDEVFMDESSYHKLTNILKLKKNLILQGAPGVGKTFSAKRLAYSMMGEKDESRVKMVQFHQSYSYEDFIMGYRPIDNGFELQKGPFYEFCKRAEEDNDRDYFFIIDEINRGNLSKIFGELLMLIEKDKRGQKLRLLYENELFSVPKNVYIIGMMNTADRSLAMIDYALRRRFAFYKLKPAFDTEGFQSVINQSNNESYKLLVEQIKGLNRAIRQDESLGTGFEIGHSYLLSDDKVTDEWISLVIDYELLPLLDEYWFDEPEKIEQWHHRLRGVLND